MMWFTSDWHLDHANILDFEKERRKICNGKISKMTDALISRYNNLIKKEDICYHLGDFSLRNSDNWYWYKRCLDKMNGIKILILGNHDKLNPFLYIDCGFQSVHTSLDIGSYILVHDPAITIVNKERKWLCGHIHTIFKKKNNVTNVGIDVWDYNPVSIEMLDKFNKDT